MTQSRRYVILGSFLALATAGVIACSDDTGTSIQAPYDGGAKPAPTGTGNPEPATDAGDAGFESDTGTVSDAGDGGAAAARFALFIGAKYGPGGKSELSVVALNPASVVGHLPIANTDSVPYTSGGRGFVLERAGGKIDVLNKAEPWKVDHTIDINDSADAGIYASNPHAVVVATDTKAYVARYSSNVVKIINVAAGTVSGSLDLSAYNAPGDPDGIVEVEDAVYDAATKRIYFLLQRIAQSDYDSTSTDYLTKCLPQHGAIVAFDTTTDTVVDLNGAAAGAAIELKGANPGSLTADFSTGTLVVAATGCFGLRADAGLPADAAPDAALTTDDKAEDVRLNRGIEAVNLAAGTTSWLYTSGDKVRLGSVIWADATHAFVQQGFGWYAWNPTQATIGAAITDFPSAPSYDGAGHIIGLKAATTADGGKTDSVVSWSVATGTSTTLVNGNTFETLTNPSSSSAILQ